MPRRKVPVCSCIHKIKRGIISLHWSLLTEDASQMEQAPFYRLLSFPEKQLNGQPENYLWSHRRWKHKNLQFLNLSAFSARSISEKPKLVQSAFTARVNC